jgi:hypothetical protein
MYWSECGKKRTWLNSRYYDNFCLEGVGKKHTKKKKKLQVGIVSILANNTIPKYKSETLKHEPACS